MDVCVVCDGEVEGSDLWCDPCWIKVKGRCLAKFATSKDMHPEKTENAKVMGDALGLEKDDD